MGLIIGRDGATSKLKVVDSSTGKEILYGSVGSVPKNVSRQHCEINLSTDGKISIKNLKTENITYVNGHEVLSKNISVKDTVQLGLSKYSINLPSILKDFSVKVADPKNGKIADPPGNASQTIDLRPLKTVWNEYNDTIYELNVKERRLNALSKVSGLFSMAAIASGILLKGQDNYLYYWLYGAAILLTLGFTVVSYINASRIPQKREKLKEEFMNKYVCPNPACHHFMGFTYYSVLSQNNCCPYCKTKYSMK